MAPFSGHIELHDYDQGWLHLFESEADRLRSILDSGVVRLEHVGSTAVPGLAAKPIIDMVLVVVDSSDEDSYLADLEKAGYLLQIREPDWFEHRVFKGPAANINLHVFLVGCPEIERMLLFRDWLRSNDEDRLMYESVKRDLATRDCAHVQNYADAKNDIVDEIVSRARASGS